MRRIGVLAAGALPALAFPAPALWWLAWIALVPWLLLLRAAPGAREALVLGWLGGTGFMLATHHWLVPNLHVFLLPLAALLGLLWAPWGWLAHRTLRGPPGAALVVVPAAWLMVELVRSWEYLGGPWGLLGASQWQVPAMLAVASVGGVWLVSGIVVLVNTAVATVLVRRPGRWRPAVAAAGLAACGLLVAGAATLPPGPERTGVARVAVVQPGVAPSATARFDRGAELTGALAGRGLDLVVWAESSVGFDLGARPDLTARLAELAARTGAPVLVNVDARRADGTGVSKTSVLIGPEGPVTPVYDKIRLVPFGEYVPLRTLLGWATAVGEAAEEDRIRGSRQVLMDAGGLRVAPLVCFESAFPDMSRTLAGAGAQLLVAQSSTSTFQDSWAPMQHASLAALRAAETGRPMVHSTLTGVSAVFGPEGEPVDGRLGTDESAARIYDVPLAAGTTGFVRWGDWALYAAGAGLAGYGAAAGWRRWRGAGARVSPGVPGSPR